MKYQLLAALPFFQGIAENDLQQILDTIHGGVMQYEKNAFLIHVGQTVPAAGLILSGTAHILREDFWGNRTIVAEIPKGALFAETYAFLNAPAEVNVQAASDMEVLYLHLQKLLTPDAMQNPTFTLLAHRFLQSFAQRNLTLTRKIAHITCRTTREKLLSFLSLYAQEAGNPFFSIPFNRQQLADYLAIDRSAMCAELSRMKQDGLLDYHKNQFRLFRQNEITSQF